MNMNLLDHSLDGFSPELYIATLSKLAHSDGLHSDEQELLDPSRPTIWH